jgi:hypothetical protein
MPQGWIVVVRRRGRAIDREVWDCAIPNAISAEKAVRRVSEPVGPRAITAHTPLTAFQVQALGLKAGEIRRRLSE